MRVPAVFRSVAAAAKKYPTRNNWARASPQSSGPKSYRSDLTAINSSISNCHRRFSASSTYRQIPLAKRPVSMASDPAVDKILAGKYPAKKHAENVAKYVRDAHPEITDGLIYLESTKSALLEDNDSEGELFSAPPPTTGTAAPPPPSPRYTALISIHYVSRRWLNPCSKTPRQLPSVNVATSTTSPAATSQTPT